MYTALLVDTKKVHQTIHQRYITIHHFMNLPNGKRTAETSVCKQRCPVTAIMLKQGIFYYWISSAQALS